ncbi:unnamed protein product [Rhizophagus irregularis]|nr:unnamed protein product [Rhizophagus irregularis]
MEMSNDWTPKKRSCVTQSGGSSAQSLYLDLNLKLDLLKGLQPIIPDSKLIGDTTNNRPSLRSVRDYHYDEKPTTTSAEFRDYHYEQPSMNQYYGCDYDDWKYNDRRYDNRKYDNRKYDDRKYDNRKYDDRKYDNRKYDDRKYDNRKYDDRKYDNRKYDDRKYNNRKYDDKKYDNRKYDDRKYDNRKYDDKKYDNRDRDNSVPPSNCPMGMPPNSQQPESKLFSADYGVHIITLKCRNRPTIFCLECYNRHLIGRCLN